MYTLGVCDGYWEGMGQRQTRGAFDDRVEVVGGVGGYISHKTKVILSIIRTIVCVIT